MSEERKTVKNQRIVLDAAEYKDTHFDGCELVISGKGPVRLINCTFGENEIGLDGAAARTIDTIMGMYTISFFKPFVEALVDRIRGRLKDEPRHWHM
jgi:hypothetical protein